MATNCKTLAQNKKVSHDYSNKDTFERGVLLTDTEIKTIRAGKIQLKESFVRTINGEAFLMRIPLPKQGPTAIEDNCEQFYQFTGNVNNKNDLIEHLEKSNESAVSYIIAYMNGDITNDIKKPVHKQLAYMITSDMEFFIRHLANTTDNAVKTTERIDTWFDNSNSMSLGETLGMTDKEYELNNR